MKDFGSLLEEAVGDIGASLIDQMAVQAQEALTDFFQGFVSSGTARSAVDYYVTPQRGADGTLLEVQLGTPLNFFLTGTGEFGPETSGFIVAARRNVLSWDDGGKRMFASYVYNPGFEQRFSEQDMADAIVDHFRVEE
jgi:hypothetical protein